MKYFTLILTFFLSFNFFAQQLVYPKPNCKSLRGDNENYVTGDKYIPYCDFKKQTPYVICMCSFEKELAQYKRDKANLEDQRDTYREIMFGHKSEKESSRRAGDDIWFSIDKESSSFESEKQTALRHYENALSAALKEQSAKNDVKEVAYRLGSNQSSMKDYLPGEIDDLREKIQQVKDAKPVKKLKITPQVSSSSSTNSSVNEDAPIKSERSQSIESTPSDNNTSGSRSSDTKESDFNPATYKSPEQLEAERQAENRANKARIAEQERRRKKEEEAKARKKFREDRAKAASQRQDVATAMGASSAILLVQIATIMYDGMGNHKGSDTYLGNQFYLGTNFGYSTTASTVSSISETVNFNAPSTTSSELAHFVNINIDWDLFMGYEADNYGAEMEVGVRPGFFPLFTSFNLSSQIKWKAYGGLPYFKGYFDYQYGTRRWYIEQWISDVSSEASVLYNYDRFGLGIRGTFLNDGRNYSRSHLSVGFVWDRARQAIKPSSREISTSVNFKEESRADERARERKGFLSPFYTGVSIEWNKEHSFKLYARYFNSYPFIGPSAQAPERESGSYLFEFGFIRQIKSFK